MVRLVITDFPTKEENEEFYLDDEFDLTQRIFTYHKFKKHSVILSKYDIHQNIYSLNLLSKKYLDFNQLLVHICDEEYYILFNHKTVYRAKINANFITDDIMKSILMTKHIAMLSRAGDIDKIHYVINSRYHHAVENILKQNTKNEEGEVIAYSLGNVEDLVLNLTELDDMKTYASKMTYLFSLGLILLWVMAFGLDILSNKFFYKQSLEKVKNDIKLEKRMAKRQSIILKRTKNEYKILTQCITNPQDLK